MMMNTKNTAPLGLVSPSSPSSMQDYLNLLSPRGSIDLPRPRADRGFSAYSNRSAQDLYGRALSFSGFILYGGRFNGEENLPSIHLPIITVFSISSCDCCGGTAYPVNFGQGQELFKIRRT